MCEDLAKGEIFSKLRYEASLVAQNNPAEHDTSDDYLLAQ